MDGKGYVISMFLSLNIPENSLIPKGFSAVFDHLPLGKQNNTAFRKIDQNGFDLVWLDLCFIGPEKPRPGHLGFQVVGRSQVFEVNVVEV